MSRKILSALLIDERRMGTMSSGLPIVKQQRQTNRGDWENELARQILSLYGSAMKSEAKIAGAESDFAVDSDAALASKVKLSVVRANMAKASSRENYKKPAPVAASRVRPVWFLGSGSLCADWTSLSEDSEFCTTLAELEERGKYRAYLQTVETSLNRYAQQLVFDDDASIPPERDEDTPLTLFHRLWRQLVVTANVFGMKCVEQQRNAEALDLLKYAYALTARSEMFADKQYEVAELRAFIDDSYAFYYYKRGKCNAALDSCLKAIRVHTKLKQWPHLAKCHLHSACVLSRLRRHADALESLGSLLQLVPSNKLDIQGASGPHKLCMIAIAYHNLAVEQLRLNHLQDAVTSAQNARRLARLCLSYSNRWLHNFEQTHKVAIEHLAQHSSLTSSPLLNALLETTTPHTDPSKQNHSPEPASTSTSSADLATETSTLPPSSSFGKKSSFSATKSTKQQQQRRKSSSRSARNKEDATKTTSRKQQR